MCTQSRAPAGRLGRHASFGAHLLLQGSEVLERGPLHNHRRSARQQQAPQMLPLQVASDHPTQVRAAGAVTLPTHVLVHEGLLLSGWEMFRVLMGGFWGFHVVDGKSLSSKP